jgi:hypothetical protein
MRRALVPLSLVALAAAPALAYDEQIHTLLEERALPRELLATPVVPATLEDADALRAAIWAAGAAHPDPDVRRRFLARFPTAAGFDRWAWKELLALAPEAEVYGIDRLPPAQATIGAIVAAGAPEPDEDRRNQERFAHDAQRRPLRDRYGETVPLDPAQLDMGSLHGTPSQAHAHCGLPPGPRSDDVEVLKKEPWRWSYPPTAMAFAPNFAQMQTDLAICAAALGRPGGAALGWLYLAQGDHYIGDVANQIHTLQAIYGFFYDAKVESYKEELRSLGGLLRSRPDFVTIGLGIIKNHHFLVEDLWAKRLFEVVATGSGQPGVAAALDALAAGDPALEHALDAQHLESNPEAARAITETVILASAPEGGAVYENIRALALPSLSRVGTDYVIGSDPDRWLRPDPPPGAIETLYRLQSAGFARAGTALRRHTRLYLAEVERARTARQAVFDAAAQRLIADQLAYLDAADARRASYEPRPPRVETINWLVPGGLALVLALVVGLPAWLIVRRRRRSARAASRS